MGARIDRELSLTQQMKDFCDGLRNKENTLFRNCCIHALKSIRVGSFVTGAPGQPVDKGALLDSWRYKIVEKGQRFEVESKLDYAPIIEDNLRGARLKSRVGGFHSLKLTRLGWRKIVKYEIDRMGSGKVSDISNLGSAGQMRTTGEEAWNEEGIVGQFTSRLEPKLKTRARSRKRRRR